MLRRSFYGRVALICLAGSIAACGGPQAPTAPPSQPGMLVPVQPGSGQTHETAPSAGATAPSATRPADVQPLLGTDQSQEAASPPVQIDPNLLNQLPSSIPQDFAQSNLQTVSAAEISTGFNPLPFQGEAGTYLGFAPGFDATLLDQAHFLPIDGIWIPYVFVQGAYVPLCFYEQGTGFYFYPELIVVEGVFIPVYRVVTILFDPYSIVLPVEVPQEWVSPIDIGAVPAPLTTEPEVVRSIRIVNRTTVINNITNIETNIAEPVTVSPQLVARVNAVQQTRLAQLPARIRQRIEDRKAHGSPLVVPMTPAIQHNVIVRRQQEEKVRRQAARIVIQPPQAPSTPTERRPVTPVERRPATPVERRPVTPVARRPATPTERPLRPQPTERQAPAPIERRRQQPQATERRAPSDAKQQQQTPVEPHRRKSKLFKEPAAGHLSVNATDSTQPWAPTDPT